MKRILGFVLAGMMMVSLAACGTEGTKEPETLGEALRQEFHANAGEMDAQEMANTLLASEWISFSGMTTPVEEGLLTGFGNEEIKGFDEAVMFGPMIGTIPFIGYVFEMEEDADIEAFENLLKEESNLAWNVCTQAEETVIENAEDMVLFVMCPRTMEE